MNQIRCDQGNNQTPKPVDDSADTCRLVIADLAQVKPTDGSRAKLEGEYEYQSHNKKDRLVVDLGSKEPHANQASNQDNLQDEHQSLAACNIK